VFMLAIINAEFLLWMYDELYFFNFCIFPSRQLLDSILQNKVSVFISIFKIS
jgi:hypothetical protein